MKHRILSLFTALMAVMILHAQEYMVIEKTDGTSVKMNVDEVKQVSFEVTKTLSVSPTEVTLGSASNSKESIKVTSNTSWEITGNPSWLSLSTKSGTGNATITLTATANISSSNRTATLIISDTSGEKSVSVSVIQKGATISDVIYREPYTAWGATMTQTKNYMSSYTLYDEDTNSLAYYGKDKELLIMYMFDNSKLYSAAVAIETSKTTITAIGNQLTRNGYTYLGESDGTHLYSSNDSKTYVMIGTSTTTTTSVYQVTYIDASRINNNGTLFEAPYTNWSASPTLVKSTMSSRGYTLETDKTTSTGGYLGYSGKYKEILSMYSFNSNNKLEQIDILLLASTATVSDTREYLTSELKYTYVNTTSSGGLLFLSNDYNTVVLLQSSQLNGTNVTLVSFVSYDSIMGTRQAARGYTNDLKIDDNMPLSSIKLFESLPTDSWLVSGLIKQIKQHTASWPAIDQLH